MLSCLLNGKRIDCYGGLHTKEQLKAWAAKGILLCPACGKPYEYCHEEVKMPYFRHKDKNICEDKYSEPETEEHKKGKKDLYEWIKIQPGVTNAELEGWLPATKQRPDIMFKYKGQQCVLEYQCSPISSEYIERHELYQAAGVKDIWVCGAQKFFQEFHHGSGIKQIATIENSQTFYYDPISKNVYTIVPFNKKEYEKLFSRKKQTDSHFMKNIYDYVPGMVNYYEVKSSSVNYTSEYYYPSGRRSNKYPYPVRKSIYSSNRSVAKCLRLSNLRLVNIE